MAHLELSKGVMLRRGLTVIVSNMKISKGGNGD